MHEGEWCCVEEEGGSEAAEIVEVLQGMHGEAGEGLNVCVSVVDAVDVFVHGGNVDKSAISFIIIIKYLVDNKQACVQSKSGTLGIEAPRRQQG